VEAIDEAEEPSIQRLLAGASRESWAIRELGTYNWQSGMSKLVLAALSALAPRDVSTGHPIDLPMSLNAIGSRLVQPVDGEMTGALHGSRVLHPPPGGSGGALEDSLREAPQEVRASHLIRLGQQGSSTSRRASGPSSPT
jgi:hypothetical protein